MSVSSSPRIFISYSTKDGAEYAAKLRRDLEAEGLSVWQDLVALRGHADWWSQIEQALRDRGLQHFVLVVTPGALVSPVVRREIRLARQEGKTVSPVRGPGVDRLGDLPRWLGNVYDLEVPERRALFLTVLRGPSEVRRVPPMAPKPPPDFVPRPAEFAPLKAKLLDPEGDAVAITAALRGAGGYGKTTLAKALAHDQDIQDAYFDGVLWVELGEQGGDRVLGQLSTLVALLTGNPARTPTVEGLRTELAEALGNRRILLIVDDVWERRDLEPFLHGGEQTTRLVTTRFDRVLPDVFGRQTVDAMQGSEAATLIGSGLPDDQSDDCGGDLSGMAARLGEWPQLLKLANGFLRQQIDRGMRLDRAIADLAARFDARGLTALDRNKPEERHQSVAKVIETSLDLLETDQRRCFSSLAVFPEDVDVPVGVLERLWDETEDLDRFATEDLLNELFGMSLLLSLDLNRRTFRLHDTTRHYLITQAGEERLADLHLALARAVDGVRDPAVPEGEYVYRYLPEHLKEAGDHGALDTLLLDPDWLKGKLAATASPISLVSDYDRYGRTGMQGLIGRTLRLTSGICARDTRQLLPQLFGRLMASPDPAAHGFLTSTRDRMDRPGLLTALPSLTPPGKELARLEGHSNWVTALAVLPDGRLASGSDDHTVRLWDTGSGKELARLEGHSNWVTALAVLPDGRLASGSYDNKVRLWDTGSGKELARLEGHSGRVTALAVLPDGRLASGSDDHTVRLWDTGSGKELARLEGHRGRVTALAVLPDGRLASGSYDNTVRLWDTGSGKELARLEGHSNWVTALAVLPDGRLASGSYDNKVRLWDTGSGKELARLEGHSGRVTDLAVLPDGRLASGSDDHTVRLWDTGSGKELARLEGHSNWVRVLAVLPDGRLASGSDDNTVRLWDTGSGKELARLEGHSSWATDLAVLPDGRLASGSGDDTVRLWDTGSGKELARLEGRSGRVTALAALPDGRLASGSDDNTVRLWDTGSGKELARLEGHSNWVRVLAVLPDGRLASGSSDNTVRLWDTGSGKELARLEGHSDWVTALAVLPDGRLASGSDDHTVRLWDTGSGKELARLEGHSHEVTALAVLPDGRLASGSDDHTVRLWDTGSGKERARLEGHSSWVTALAVLPDGRLASGSGDNTVRLWDTGSGEERARLEVDAPVLCLTVLPFSAGAAYRLVAGDAMGRLHWLEILE